MDSLQLSLFILVSCFVVSNPFICLSDSALKDFFSRSFCLFLTFSVVLREQMNPFTDYGWRC